MGEIISLKEYKEEKRKEARAKRERDHQIGRNYQWCRWLKFKGIDPKEYTVEDIKEFRRIRGNDVNKDPWLEE